MALTLEVEHRLENAQLDTFFTKSRVKWEALAKQAYEYEARNFPGGAKPRMDDVAKALVPLLEVNEDLGEFLAENKLKQKYWIRDFCDLILDRYWQKIPQSK